MSDTPFPDENQSKLNAQPKKPRKPKKKRPSKKEQIEQASLSGMRDLKAIRSLLERLKSVGTERDKAGNRTLHMNEYCLMVLFWLYNPIIDSMRALQQANELEKVQKRFRFGRTSLGSLSESVRVFDPELLVGLAEELSQRLPERTPEKFHAIDKKITAVDGSVFKVLSQIAELSWVPVDPKKSVCGYRMHTQFEVFRGTPERIDVTSANPKGDNDERVVLQKSLKPGHCYIADRGYEKYALWNAIDSIESDYVIRIRDNPTYKTIEDRPLTEEDKKHNVTSDQIVCFGTSNTRTEVPNHTTRVIIVKVKPHDSRKKKNASGGPSSDGYLRIVTNNLDIPAYIVAELYLLRWTIEIYFRMIKQLLGCRHLLSHKQNGVTIQIYLAIIACILILSLTGKQPRKRTFEMLCLYLMGWASLDEMDAHIKKLAEATP